MAARPLRPGGCIDVIAPASSFDRAAFEDGIAFLRSRGLHARFRPDIFDRDRFLAGHDDRRIAELQAALDAPDSDAIWCARGGYGATRLLGSLSIARIRVANKLLIGFSDITALHARWLVAGVPSIHGGMVARLPREPVEVQERLLALISTGAIPPPLTGKSLTPGVAEGRLVGGNLALLAAMCGTPYQPDFSGAIVFIEDVGERSFRIDRMFIQCEQAGLFRGIAGLAFGEFHQCGEADAPVAEVLAEHARHLQVPAVQDLPCGHGDINMALPFGVRARLDATEGRLEFLEPVT